MQPSYCKFFSPLKEFILIFSMLIHILGQTEGGKHSEKISLGLLFLTFKKADISVGCEDLLNTMFQISTAFPVLKINEWRNFIICEFKKSFLLRDNDITGVLDHTFCVEHNAYGEIVQHELKPNGKSISVTQDTKKEYVRLYVNWRFLRGIEAQFLALQKGFNEVIPQHLLKAFDEKELEASGCLHALPVTLFQFLIFFLHM